MGEKMSSFKLSFLHCFLYSPFILNCYTPLERGTDPNLNQSLGWVLVGLGLQTEAHKLHLPSEQLPNLSWAVWVQLFNTVPLLGSSRRFPDAPAWPVNDLSVSLMCLYYFLVVWVHWGHCLILPEETQELWGQHICVTSMWHLVCQEHCPVPSCERDLNWLSLCMGGISLGAAQFANPRAKHLSPLCAHPYIPLWYFSSISCRMASQFPSFSCTLRTSA